MTIVLKTIYKDLNRITYIIMQKVAIIIPVHPPKIKYASQLLESYKNNKNYIDIFLVFTSDEDKNFFVNNLADAMNDINLITLDDRVDLNILKKNLSYINFKKLYALNYISKNFNYQYTIIIDCDSIFLDMCNIHAICERFCSKKEVYGTKIVSKNTIGVPELCKAYIEKCGNVKYPDLDIDTYFWFSQIPIYDMNICKPFLDFINIDHPTCILDITYSTFDYYIYIYYCVVYHSYKIINLNEYGIYTEYEPNWSLEWNLDSKVMNKLIENNIEINWQSYKFKDVLHKDICIYYHTDRRTLISKSEILPP